MRVSVGVDVGDARIAAGAADDSGEILAPVRKPMSASNSDAVADTIGERVKGLTGSYGVGATDIEAAGFVDRERTTVVFAPNLAWRNESLAEKVSQATGHRVVVENDANTVAWEEFESGAASGRSSAVVVTVGAGIDGGIIVGSALLYRVGGFTGEIGHIVVNPEGQRYGCGVLGCWEAQASDTVLVRTTRQLAADSPVYDAHMFKLAGDREITGLDVTRAAQADDPAALEYFVEIAERTRIGMATLNAAIDPEVFVLTGGIDESGDLLAIPARTFSEKSLTAEKLRPTPLVKLATLGNNADIIDAADLARR